MLEHEPKATLPGRDLSGCVIPVPLHTAGLGLSAGLHKPCSGTRKALAAVLALLLALVVTGTSSGCLTLAVLLVLDSITSVA